jgi:PHD/YefM family antitoxin component YafN of YafNO toxin-antitoxin module
LVETVTKHGKPAVVIISAEEYEPKMAPKKSLAVALKSCPEALAPLLGTRQKQMVRNVPFE